jgi:hypothetical protein
MPALASMTASQKPNSSASSVQICSWSSVSRLQFFAHVTTSSSTSSRSSSSSSKNSSSSSIWEILDHPPSLPDLASTSGMGSAGARPQPSLPVSQPVCRRSSNARSHGNPPPVDSALTLTIAPAGLSQPNDPYPRSRGLHPHHVMLQPCCKT